MSKLDIAIQLRKEGNLEASNKLLIELVCNNPNDAIINFHCAWSYDSLGLESSAIEYYKRAIEIGLPTKEETAAYIGLGSTYRALGMYSESKFIFEEGLKKYSEHNAMRIFYAMTLYNIKDHSRSMELLLNIMIDTTSDQEILKYKGAIGFYSNKLNEIW